MPVSHSMRHTKRRQYPNLQTKRIWVPEEGRFIKMKICTKALKAMAKNGRLRQHSPKPNAKEFDRFSGPQRGTENTHKDTKRNEETKTKQKILSIEL